MKVTIRSLTNLNKDLKTVLMGGEKEEIFFIDFSTDNKVKKGELHLHPSLLQSPIYNLVITLLFLGFRARTFPIARFCLLHRLLLLFAVVLHRFSCTVSQFIHRHYFFPLFFRASNWRTIFRDWAYPASPPQSIDATYPLSSMAFLPLSSFRSFLCRSW